MHGGYGIYYDRITLEIESLERGLDGRALPIEVRAGNVFFLDPNGRRLPPFAPVAQRTRSPASSCRAPARPASTSSTTRMQNPTVQQFNLGVEHELGAAGSCCASTACTHLGTHFIIGRTIGEVFNPVVGGPDRVVNLESSVEHEVRRAAGERRAPLRRGAVSFRASYTLATAFNYANDDQIPFWQRARIDPTNLQKEYGPDARTDRRHRFTSAGSWNAPADPNLSADLDAARPACRWTS